MKVAGTMPTGLIDKDDGVGTGSHGAGNFL
jgi:hypothetical protein